MSRRDPSSLSRRQWLGVLGALPVACIPPALRPARCYVGTAADPSCREVLWSYNSMNSSRSTVIRPRDEADLRQTLREFPQHGRRFSVRGGGAALDRQSLNDDTVIALDHSTFKQIVVDPDALTLTVGAGATWQEVYDRTLPLGLTPFCTPSASFIRVGGGLAANSFSRLTARWGREERYLLGFTLIGPDGRAYDCRPDQPEGSLERELFFAVPGSQGYLGVVTRMRYALRRIAEPDVLMSVRTDYTVEDLGTRDEYGSALANFLNELDRYAGAPSIEAPTERALNTRLEGDGVFGTVWWERDPRRRLRGLIGRTTYVPRPPGDPPRGLLNQRGSFFRIFGEYGFAEPGGEASLQDINFVLARCAPVSIDPVDDFAFFQDADARAKHYVESRWRMTAAEQAFCIPLPKSKDFFDALDIEVRRSGHFPALVDILYSPRDLHSHPLSATSESNAMVFTVAYVDRDGDRWRCTLDVYRALTRVCASLGGKIYLAKTVEADVADLETMYGDGVRALRAIKRRVDPRGLLANEFWDRNLACLAP